MSPHESSPTTADLGANSTPSGIIDLTLALVEKAHLLVIVPLAAGILAWGAAGLLPDYYKSEASINAQLSVPPGVRSEDVILHPLNFTRLLLTRIDTEELRAVALDKAGAGPSRTTNLQLRARRDPATGIIHLTATAATAESAQAALGAAIEKLSELSRPHDQVRAELESSIAAMSRQLDRIEKASRLVKDAELARDSGLRAGELAIAQVKMVESELQLRDRIHHASSLLAGLRPEAVIMAPTLPLSPDGPARTRIGIATWLITGLLLVMIILLKEALSGVQMTGVQLRRWELIRQRFQRR